MDFYFNMDIPIEKAYEIMRHEEDLIKQKEQEIQIRYENTMLKCNCGCDETYLRKNEDKFKKTNLKHLIVQRDKLLNDVEFWKGKVKRGERERYYTNGENSDDGYDSDTTTGQPPAMLEEAEEELKEVEEILKN